MIHNHFAQHSTSRYTTTELSIVYHDSQPLAQNNTPWLLWWASGCESWWVMLSQWLWIMVYHAEQVVENHGLSCWAIVVNPGELCCDSGYESWCAMLSQWFWVMVCNAEAEVVNHGVLWWASGCESWSVMLCQRLWIMVSYSEPVVVNHGVLWWAAWSTTTGSDLHTMINNHWLSITHHNSHPLAQHYTPWITTTGSA
jgi:hypothetical protein